MLLLFKYAYTTMLDFPHFSKSSVNYWKPLIIILKFITNNYFKITPTSVCALSMLICNYNPPFPTLVFSCKLNVENCSKSYVMLEIFFNEYFSQVLYFTCFDFKNQTKNSKI